MTSVRLHWVIHGAFAPNELLISSQSSDAISYGHIVWRQTSLDRTRPLVKSVHQKIHFLISQPKHMLWVLKRTVSMRRFF